MEYSRDLTAAARRHFLAADVLYSQDQPADRPPCKAVAGYLFGIAGELAVKGLMQASGIRPLPREQRRDDPYYAHFPELKRMLADAHGRRSGELRKISEDGRLFNNWDISMRYAPTQEILGSVDRWRESAKQLVDRMGAV